jgi:hypothetical protein
MYRSRVDDFTAQKLSNLAECHALTASYGSMPLRHSIIHAHSGEAAAPAVCVLGLPPQQELSSLNVPRWLAPAVLPPMLLLLGSWLRVAAI